MNYQEYNLAFNYKDLPFIKSRGEGGGGRGGGKGGGCILEKNPGKANNHHPTMKFTSEISETVS